MMRGRHFRSARVQRGNARSDQASVGSEQDNPAQTDDPDLAGLAKSVRGRHGYLSRLTPRAMTSTDSMSAETDSSAISSLARGDRGMVSVGLKADEFVTEM